jgi:two-component system cell cycle sensor histidine kinase PleC
MRKLAMAREDAEGLYEGSARQRSLADWQVADLLRQNRALEAEVEKARRVARQLQAERDRAIEADHAKSMFLAAMSHDLRTPLTAILGFSDMMKHGVFGPIDHPRYHSYVENIHTSGQLLLDLINNILDLSKIDAGKRTLTPQALDGKAITADCLGLVASATGGRDVGVEIRADGDGLVWGDELAFRQIMINLLSNAVKFTPDGGRVEIAIGDMPDGGTQVTVADTGPGMDEDGVRTALDPFGQIAGERRLNGVGTGLGLPIVVRLVELHGGRFTIDSKLGQGTKIGIWLPASNSAAI